MKKFARFFVGLGIFLIGCFIAWVMWITRPQAQEKTDEMPLPIVEFQPVEFQSVEIVLPSQGMIEPARRTSLASEVGGKVVRVSEKFDVGGTFKKGEVILEIDSSDYQAALARNQSALAQAELNFETEKARGVQALRDWKKLGKGKTANDLTLRKPQLAAAQAAMQSAMADTAKAKRDLERTRVKVPFSGTIEAKRTEIGNYLAPGAPVADLFESAPFEIRLPVSLNDARFVKTGADGAPIGEVAITSGDLQWAGKIVRTEGSIDRMSRSMHLIAEIGDGADEGEIPLQPGLFVQAGITGTSVANVVKVPFPAFLDLEKVVVIDPDDKLRFREVEVLRREAGAVLVIGGLKNGERLCLTELPDMIEGMIVDPRVAHAPPVLTDVPEGEEEVKP